MRWVALVLGLLGLVLLQTSSIPAFELFGVAPNVLLVMLCCWAVVRDQEEAMLLVPLAGIFIGLLSFQGTAVSVAAFAPIVVLATLRSVFSRGVQMGLRTEYVWVLGLVVTATLLHFITFAVAVEVEGSRIDWGAAVTDRMLPAVLVNVGIALALYWVVRLPTRRPQPRVI